MSLRLSEKAFKKLVNEKGAEGEKKTKQNKYHNEKIEIDGIRYDSKREYLRHKQLLLKEKAGEIQNLRFHDKKDTIILQKTPLIKYEPDFCYEENGKLIIEDLKGYQTKEFKLKKKMIISKIYSGELNAVFRLTKFEKRILTIIEEYKESEK